MKSIAFSKTFSSRLSKLVIERARQEDGEGSPEFEVYTKKIGKPRVFGIDSRDALMSRETNDASLWRRSRFNELLPALEEFLSRYRGAVTLQVPVNRIIASGNEILSAVAVREKSLTMSSEEFAQKSRKAEEELEVLRKRKTKELEAVTEREAKVRESALGGLKGLNTRIENAAGKAVDEASITHANVATKEEIKKTTERVQSLAMKAVRKELERCCEGIAQEINKGIADASQKLEEFIAEVDRTVQNINADSRGSTSVAPKEPSRESPSSQGWEASGRATSRRNRRRAGWRSRQFRGAVRRPIRAGARGDSVHVAGNDWRDPSGVVERRKSYGNDFQGPEGRPRPSQSAHRDSNSSECNFEVELEGETKSYVENAFGSFPDQNLRGGRCRAE